MTPVSNLVLKFGGTSMGDLACIANAADIIINAKKQGHQIAVVVSAMSGETDRLINLAKDIELNPSEREYSTLVSTGEQVSMALLAMTLHKKGVEARSYTGWQAGVKTSSDYKRARIQAVECDRVKAFLDTGGVAIVAGFQGIDEDGQITTLGRGGSDTSAVALAHGLNAIECRIYTDVDGVYTTDPRVVREARRLDCVTFEEMLEMASLGAKVLQIRSVEYAGKYNVPMRVLSSFKEGPGTLITYEEATVEQAKVSGIAFNRSEAKITLHNIANKPGVAARVLSVVSDNGIDIDMIVQNLAEKDETHMTFTVHRDDYERSMALLTSCTEIGASEVTGSADIAKVSLVGVGMRSHAGIASQMFQTLGEEGINIHLITTSEIKISVVIDEKYLELAVRSLHSAFHLEKAPNEEFDPLPATQG